MKNRLGSILNDLNITLDTAIERLKMSGIKNARKDFTLNTVVSEEEILILSTNSQAHRGSDPLWAREMPNISLDKLKKEIPGFDWSKGHSGALLPEYIVKKLDEIDDEEEDDFPLAN